jgi:hypothetical protein
MVTLINEKPEALPVPREWRLAARMNRADADLRTIPGLSS